VVNPTANPTANVAANPIANTVVNIAGNIVNNVANSANTFANAVENRRQNTGVQPPLVQANHIEGSQHQRIRDEVEIARRANYDRNHGVPDTLDAHNPHPSNRASEHA
jgi:hypothetical protein